jgi:hypothetical protein
MLLKDKLIDAIEALLENSQDPDTINDLLAAIKERKIQDKPIDYWTANWILYLIHSNWPASEVENNPGNKKFIKLGKECLKKSLPVIEECEQYLKSLITPRKHYGGFRN